MYLRLKFAYGSTVEQKKGFDRPIWRVRYDSTGVDEIRVYDDATLGPVQRGDLDVILHGICPEHSSAQVIDGDALWAIQIC